MDLGGQLPENGVDPYVLLHFQTVEPNFLQPGSTLMMQALGMSKFFCIFVFP